MVDYARDELLAGDGRRQWRNSDKSPIGYAWTRIVKGVAYDVFRNLKDRGQLSQIKSWKLI